MDFIWYLNLNLPQDILKYSYRLGLVNLLMHNHQDNTSDRVVVSDAIVFNKSNRTIYVTKPQLTPEDTVAFKFANVLERSGIDYTVVAGYVAILFGRARRSDDIDFILEVIDGSRFVELCKEAHRGGFSLMQGDIDSEDSVRNIYRSYLAQGYSVRFMYGDVILPNIEVKLAGIDIYRYAVANSIRAVVNGEHVLKISPLELQIAYKLYLNSDKDVGDAIFLYTLFREVLSKEDLYRWCRTLRIDCKILEG